MAAIEAADIPNHMIILKNDARVGQSYPLHKVTDEHARRFFEKYELHSCIEKDVFIRAVLAYRHREVIESRFVAPVDAPFELKIGRWKYTQLEISVLFDAWTKNKWQTLRDLSRLHWLLIVACIFAAMTQGWDQAAMAGAALEVMKDLGKPITSTVASNSTSRTKDEILALNENIWWFGLFTGAPFLFGSLIGLLVTDRLTEVWQFGRRGAVVVAGLCSFVSVIGSASVHNWKHFLGFRIILGAGMAGKASIIPIWLSETSPRNVRGVLLVCWQLFVAFGIAAGSVANLSLYRLNPSHSWRYMFISAFIPALLLFSLILFSPESPRWLLKRSGIKRGDRIRNDKSDQKSKERVRKALISLSQLHGKRSDILAAGELFLMYKRLLEEQKQLEIDPNDPKRFNAAAMESDENEPLDVSLRPDATSISYVSWKTRWVLMFSTVRMRRANAAAAAVMLAQQLCGINLLAFLADTFFRRSFFSDFATPTLQDNTKLLAFSVIFGAWNFISTIPALFYIDRSDGRRKLLNWSFPGMAASLLISGLILLTPTNNSQTSRADTVAGIFHLIFLFAFTTAYSIGEGPAAFVISAEVFPLVNRELGMSLAVFWNFLGAGLLALLAPKMTEAWGQVGVLCFFAGTNILAWFTCYWLVPNTGNEDLEDVFAQLDVPTFFVFFYTLAKLWHKVRQVSTFCVQLGFLGRKSWDDFRYYENITTVQRAYKNHRGEPGTSWTEAVTKFWGSAFRRVTDTILEEGLELAEHAAV